MLDMNCICDVPGCSSPAFMGWRPLTERRGRKICERHWRRHQNPKDSFDLFDAFGFRRPAQASKFETVAKPVCNCGRELSTGRRLCVVCVAERKRQRNRRVYNERKKKQQQPTQPIEHEGILHCRACGGPREHGHAYCPQCATRRSKQSNCKRQRQYRNNRFSVAV